MTFARRDIERRILANCATAPAWARSFQHFKSILNALVDNGLLDRHRPHPRGAANMVVITDAGRARLAELRGQCASGPAR